MRFASINQSEQGGADRFRAAAFEPLSLSGDSLGFHHVTSASVQRVLPMLMLMILMLMLFVSMLLMLVLFEIF